MDYGLKLNLVPETLGETRVVYVPPCYADVLEAGGEEFDPRKHDTKVIVLKLFEGDFECRQ